MLFPPGVGSNPETIHSDWILGPLGAVAKCVFVVFALCLVECIPHSTNHIFLTHHNVGFMEEHMSRHSELKFRPVRILTGGHM